jgi:DNA-binding protein HU-beta
MTKAELIKKITSQTQIDASFVSVILESLFASIKNNMEEGNEVFIRGFGSFIIKERASKLARNIKTNTPMMVEAHVIPKFKPAPEFIELIRNSTKVKKQKS